MGILLKELGTLYAAFARDENSPLPDLPIQYADYAVWQRAWLAGEAMQEQLSYWKQQLENSVPVLDLPLDYPRSPAPQIRGVSYRFELSAALTEALRTLSRSENATLFMTLLAAFKTLLSHATGQGDIVVGSPIANRNRREIEPLIGFFVNMLVLRTQVAGEMTFRTVLAHVRETCLGGYAHQDLPFEKLVAELRMERSSMHTPLFQVLFVLQNAVRGELDLPGMMVEPYTVDFSTAKFDLNMYFTESGDHLTGVLEYNADLFKAETIERLVARLQRVLEEVTVNPNVTVEHVLAPAEAVAD
jgi:non-ribosomal peptide synthetase component F